MPAEKHGLQVVSMGFLTSDDAPVIWRGPMLHGAIQQFFRDVAWRDLDYLIVDMPPGTGDVALSLSQTVPVVGSIVVTTPQKVSLADSLRAVRMYQKLNIAPMGLVENMTLRTGSSAPPIRTVGMPIFGAGIASAGRSRPSTPSRAASTSRRINSRPRSARA